MTKARTAVPAEDYKRQKEEEKAVQLPRVIAAEFAGKPVPEFRFHDDRGMIPHTGVTLLFGDGGTGKSLLATQLAAATALDDYWLGVKVKPGAAVYFSAEDPIDVTHRRLADYVTFIGANLSDLGDLHILPMLGQTCTMAAPMKGQVCPTPVMDAFRAYLRDVRPAVAIVDNAVDVFGGDANDAAQVKQFMHMFSGISLECDCPILLLAHPSRSGMATGSGDGNSVHWSNSARSRLSLERIHTSDGDGRRTEDDPAARILRIMKSNYSATGDEIKMRWEDGCFVHAYAERVDPSDGLGSAAKAERVFLHLLRWHDDRGLPVSAFKSPTYAPSIFVTHPQSEGVTKRRFEQAMTGLLDQRKIEVQEHGPPSKRRSRLVIVEGSE